MTIARITLRNFKCFTALDLPCAPLTLLTGHNAGGKSTALQALLLLAQGLREAPNTNLLPLNGTLVDLGACGDVIHHSASPPDAVLRCRKFARAGDLALRGRQGPLGARPAEARRYQLLQGRRLCRRPERANAPVGTVEFRPGGLAP